MAAVTHLTTLADGTDATTYTTGSFTPTANDLLVVFVGASAHITEDATPLTSSAGLTFHKARTETRGGSTDKMYVFVAEALAANSGQTVTFNCVADGATGCAIAVAAVSGMSRTGSTAVRQANGQSNQAAGGTPAPTFASAALTDNACLGAVYTGTNPPALTPPTNWTERADFGHGTPARGMEYASRDSGETGTTITWGSTSATAFGDLIIELDTSSAGGAPTPKKLASLGVG